MPALQLMALFTLKKSENSKSLKVFYMKNLFPDFNLDIDEDLFQDASQDPKTLTGNQSLFLDYFDCSFKNGKKWPSLELWH